jgi:hypothetical protein
LVLGATSSNPSPKSPTRPRPDRTVIAAVECVCGSPPWFVAKAIKRRPHSLTMMFGTTREGVIVGWWVAKPFPSGNEAQNVRDWLKAAWERHLSFMDDRESYRAQVVAGVDASWRSPSSTQ